MSKYVIEVATYRGIVKSMPIDADGVSVFMKDFNDGENCSFRVYENKRAFFPAALLEQSVVSVEELTKMENPR